MFSQLISRTKNIMTANTPKPPYYAVIFSSVRSNAENGYSETADKMIESASKHEGFLGVESARNELGITVLFKNIDFI